MIVASMLALLETEGEDGTSLAPLSLGRPRMDRLAGGSRPLAAEFGLGNR